MLFLRTDENANLRTGITGETGDKIGKIGNSNVNDDAHKRNEEINSLN